MVKKLKNKEKTKKPFKKNQKKEQVEEDFEDEDADIKTSNAAEFYVDDADIISDDDEPQKGGDMDGSDLDFGEEDYISSEEEEDEVEMVIPMANGWCMAMGLASPPRTVTGPGPTPLPKRRMRHHHPLYYYRPDQLLPR